MEHLRNNRMAEIYTFIERTGERKGKERKTYWERNRCKFGKNKNEKKLQMFIDLMCIYIYDIECSLMLNN